MSGQLSFFSADASAPSYRHVEGLLAGPGQIVRREGAARVSVVVHELWRVETLLRFFTGLGWQADAVAAEHGGTAVRSPFRAELAAVADAWTHGAVKHPPAGFAFDGHALRWWAVAAGRADKAGYVLGLGEWDEPAWASIGAALAHAGLPAAFIGPRADGPAYRIVGQRRLERLHELVGARPPGVPDAAWPSAARRADAAAQPAGGSSTGEGTG